MKNFAIIALVAVAGIASADTNFHSLASGDFSQGWTDPNLINVNDNWSAVPSITGYLGDTNSGSPTGVDPRTYLAASLGAVDVIAQALTTSISGGVGEFENEGMVGLQGSGTADTPGLVFFMNSTGRTNVTFAFDAIDIDGTADNAIQQIAAQYRIGGTGDFINITNGYNADVTLGPNLSGNTVNFTLTDAAWDNQSMLEFRVITTNAIGSDEWVGIDNIRVASQAVPEPGTMIALGAGIAAFVARRRRSK